MKHLYFIKSLMLAVVCLLSATAWAAPGWQEVTNYKEDFSKATVSSSKFTTLADYWTVKGTGAVWAVSSGKVGATSNLSENTTDYLVTPQVKGDVTLKAQYCYWGAKGYSNITVYEATLEGETFVPGNKVLEQDLADYSSLTQFTIATGSADYKYYMIHISGGYIDDFAASSAYVNVPESRVLTPTAITGEWTDSKPIYADATGAGTWTGTITVKNEGNVDLAPGDENFSLIVASQSTWAVTTTMTEFAIPEALAVGEEKTFDLSVPIQLVKATDDGRTALRFTTKLLAKGNTATSSASYKQSSWFTLKTQAPKLYVRNANDNDITSYATDLGLVQAPATTTFTLRNDGGSTVVLKSIESSFVNAAWSVDDAAVVYPYEIAKGETKVFTLTLNNTGGQSSTLTFNYGNTYDETAYAVESKAVSAVVADPSLYLEHFEGQLTVPKGWCQPGWVNEEGSTWSFDSSSSNTYAVSSTQTLQGKYLISPKITFAEGQSLTVSAVPGTTSTYSSNQTYLKVLYSPDRVNWQVAKVIAMADTRDAVVGYEDKFIPWGSFSGTTIAYAKAFVIDGIPAGDYYIGFESGYAKIDYIFGGKLTDVDNDFYVTGFKVEAEKTGMVNYPVTATVSYTNMLSGNSKAHKVSLYNGDTLIEEKDVESLAAYTAAEPVVFTFTPHTTDSLYLQAKITVGEYLSATPVAALGIKAETAEGEVIVGEGTTTNNSKLGSNYKRYRAEWIMTAEQIGIAANTEITSVTLKYYNTSKDITKKAKVYLMTTEDAEVAGTKFTAVAELTPNYSNDAYVIAKAGTGAEDLAELKFSFDNSYLYDGKNIRIVVDFNGDNYASTPFFCYAGKSLQYNADGTTETNDDNTATSISYIPVAVLGYSKDVTPNTGVVTDEATNAPIANATITLTCGEVIYTGTTDAEGKYSINVYQMEKVYALTATADGYDDYAATDSVAAGTENNILMKAPVVTGVTSYENENENENKNENENGASYNLSGQRIGRDYKGIVIRKGKKYLAK